MKPVNKIKAIAVLCVFFFIGIAAIKQPNMTEFKNLQVLPKNITADSLDKIMDGFTTGLGVDCKYCHVQNKMADTFIFENDDKPEKEIARYMLRMTMEINEKYFHFNEAVKSDAIQAVTCITCHRKEPKPIVINGATKPNPFDFH